MARHAKNMASKGEGAAEKIWCVKGGSAKKCLKV